MASRSSHPFNGVLKRYNPLTDIFFTLVGEMGLALHEMYEVSGLVIGDALYEEYVLTTEELYKSEDPQVYETYWKCYASSISAGKYLSGGTGTLNKCLGRATCSIT